MKELLMEINEAVVKAGGKQGVFEQEKNGSLGF